MYLTAVAVAGLFGYVLGAIVVGDAGAGGSGAQYGSVGPVTFQLTGPNLALFGVLAVGTILGVGLLAIIYVSKRAESV